MELSYRNLLRHCIASHHRDYGALTTIAAAKRQLHERAREIEQGERVIMFVRVPMWSETSARAMTNADRRCSPPYFFVLAPGQSYTMTADTAGGVPDGDGVWLHAVAGGVGGGCAGGGGEGDEGDENQRWAM
jgi:hypothetical protein